MADILIIDDEAMLREVIAEFIKPLGHVVREAENLDEGLWLISNNHFDLILLDVNLPDGNGIEILPEIKKSAAVPEVIIITAVGDSSGAEIALENDAWDYLLKPFKPNDIRLAVKQAL